MLEPLLTEIHTLPIDAKGREFERLVAWYLQAAPEYRDIVERVYLWDEWPGRWGADAGIDLVVTTRTGERWAVQAKAYHPSYSIKKADVDSFLSESNRREFSFRLLVATTDRLGARAARTIHEQEKPVGLRLLSQLRHESIAWPANLNTLRPPVPTRLAAREHQRDAISAVVGGLRGCDRGQLIMACGTGKTLTSLWIDEALANERTLVVVPSLSLLGQTLRSWAANATRSFEYLAVCSDETVAAPDSFTSWTADLGVPVTTDAAVVGTFLKRRVGRRVVFSTYHSAPVVAEAQRGESVAFDLAILDEAHRAAGRSDSSFGTVLDATRLRARKRLFMTATPRFVSSQIRTAARELDIEVTSMDDEATFGPVLHRLSFRDAIDRGLLSDYRVVVIGVSDESVSEAVDRRDLVSISDRRVTDAATLARQIGLLRAIRRFGLRRVLTFHSRKDAARRFAESLPDVLSWMPSETRPPTRSWTAHITGDMSSGERDLLLDRLRDLDGLDWGLLANVRCLTEGVDVPTLDCVAFIDPRRSEIDIIQAAGRAIRRSPTKQLGIIVIPVLIAPHASDDAVLDSSEFRKVWSVVQALRAHDEILAEELDAARFALGQTGRLLELPSKIILDLPGSVSPDFARALSIRIVQRSTGTFLFWLGLLTRYVADHGSVTDVESRTQAYGYKIGDWISIQRGLHARGSMKPDRAAQLAALPGWVWRVKTQQPWEIWFGVLTRYLSEHGTVAGLDRTTVFDGHKIGSWAETQRRGRARGSLRKDRAARLDVLPGWSWRLSDTQWERMFDLLSKYAAREGHAIVPGTHYEDEEWLGKWVSNQRSKYGGSRLESISPDRIAKLETLPGWSWERRSEKWERAFRALELFAAREDHTMVQAGHDEDGVDLYSWVIRQRGAHAAGELQRHPGRVSRLEMLPGWRWTEPYDARWNRRFAALAKFCEREGHVLAPATHDEDGVNLHRWVGNQVRRHARGELPPEQAARLEALPGWRWGRATAPERTP